MKRYFCFIALFLFISAIPTFAQDEAQIKKELQEKYMAFLKEEGFSPTIDSDGDVKFKNEGNIFYLRPTTDKKYFEVLRILTDDNSDKFVSLLKSSNVTMKEFRLIRIIIYENSNEGFVVHFRSDNYLGEEEDFKKIFYRSLNVITSSIDFFKEDYLKK
jgi:hypothetical protein